MYKKNEMIRLEITDISNEGMGVGKTDGYTLFVKDAIPGDIIDTRIAKVKKNYGYARVENVIKPSPFRVTPACPYARQCGGCQLQALSYEEQLKFKQDKVRNSLIRIGDFEASLIDDIMEPIIGMDDPWRYRNKAQYPIGTDKKGNPIAGFYAGRTHDIISNTDCLLGVPENKVILELVLAHMKSHDIPAYDEKTGSGVIRHVLIRKGFTTGQIMICLVITNKSKKEISDKEIYFSGQEDLIGKLSQVKGVTSISVNINNEKTNVILGDKTVTLWGEDVIYDSVGEISFSISPQSFFQVNPVQMDKLYGTALEYADLTGRESVWDLYCGIGSISLFMAKKARVVYGVEVIPQAIEDAKSNAAENGIKNVRFFTGKAEEVLPDFYIGKYDDPVDDIKNTKTDEAKDNVKAPGDMKHPDVVVVGPPRKGCDRACLDTMLKMQPDRIVYVSCDPATLARDLKILDEGGYRLKRVRPCDMFPQTVHV
ncbi:MAG: 23S rRNA (uracil(1939)-C(5))-methyltransferase RlmD, partial [Lachnospiraceae bacterium]|nr:23S rRNA (uracil(1939)-C(5))-methyltransferase RlmD [Lachnospiraceae bacterium]